jgi:hypothetical protein
MLALAYRFHLKAQYLDVNGRPAIGAKLQGSPTSCGRECMTELHNFHLCNNVILTAYSWAFDKFEQFINRAHRLNSPWPVNVWSVICDGSIDRRLETGIHEKKDATEIVLDSRLLGETPAEVNLHELLCPE